jgi:hypothetical protein
VPFEQLTALNLGGKPTPANPAGSPAGYFGEKLVSELMGRYGTLVKAGRVQNALAALTAPVVFSTAAGTGGPLLWNPPASGVDAHLLAVGFSTSVVTTVAGGLGVTGGSGQTAAPGSTTAADGSGNCLVGGPKSAINAYRAGTPTTAGAFFAPYAQVHTGALTVDTTGMTWLFLDGLFVAPPGSWLSAGSGSVTLTTLQAAICAIWAELPS